MGILFTSDLKFVEHINKILSKCYKNLGFIIRNTQDFSKTAIITLFNSLIRSRLEYCSLIWDPSAKIHISVIDRIQNKFLKYLYFREYGIYPKYLSYKDMLLHYNSKSLYLRRQCQILIILYKLLHSGIEDNCLLEKINFYVAIKNKRIIIFLYISKFKTRIFQFSPVNKMMALYNNINSCDIDIFSMSLHKYLLIINKKYLSLCVY